MGTLKFRDKSAEVKIVHFKKLAVGAVFEYDKILFIKINDACAFDVCNLTLRGFCLTDNVIEREAEIVFN